MISYSESTSADDRSIAGRVFQQADSETKLDSLDVGVTANSTRTQSHGPLFRPGGASNQVIAYGVIGVGAFFGVER